jgi:coenzyme F420 hydrogenase subunit beta
MESCPVTSSRCLSFCPRFDLDLDAASDQLHGVHYGGEPFGEVRQVLVARSTDAQVRSRAQYGGTVTTLVLAALEDGTIESAVLTRNQGGIPRGVVASTPEEVLDCAGSSYLAAPTLEALNRQHGEGQLGVVGTPCQLQAVATMAVSPFAERSNAPRVTLRIGLFCTWALSYDFLSRLNQVASPDAVAKTDVPPPPASVFEVHASGSRTTIPLEEVRTYIRPACDLCPDMTAELADISVGSAEGIEGWNTLLVRTEAGERLVEAALARGLLETGPLPQANCDHLAEAAMNKKRRAFRRVAERTGDAGDLLFMKLRPEVASRLIQD